MRQPDGGYVVSRDQYDAVLFDLDGVVTNTAKLHAACWKQMFDEYLQKRAGERAEAFRPFDLATDYRLYLDVKPRFDGVRDFPASRGIKLPGGLSSGVHARSSGHFGLVIGVARKGDAEELRQHGANVVVNDLSELVD